MTAATVVDLVNRRHNLTLSLDGKCEGGEVGAYRVSTGDLRRLVFKWSENPSSEARLRRLAEVLMRLHASGYPLPQYEPILPFDGGVFIAQEWLAGRWSDDVSDDVVSQLLACQHLHRGRGDDIDDEPWGAFILRTLRTGADGWALHHPLRGHSAETRAMLAWIEAVGHHACESTFPNDDLVHIDFHHRNALRDGGGLIGVIDWEGARQGDAAFDLVTLAFGLAAAACSTEARDRVWHEAARQAGDCLPAYVAHMALRRLDWTIRFHAEEVPFWLSVCQEFASRVEWSR